MPKAGFESGAPLAVSQVTANVWETTAPLIFWSSDGTRHEVPVGTTTDFASIPTVVTWLVAKMTGAPAAVLHDHAWDLANTRQISYRTADRLLREALAAVGVGAPSRYLMWSAVRWADLLTRRGGWRGWHKDAPAVIAVTIPGLVLASPAILLLPSMALLAALNHIATKLSKEIP